MVHALLVSGVRRSERMDWTERHEAVLVVEVAAVAAAAAAEEWRCGNALRVAVQCWLLDAVRFGVGLRNCSRSDPDRLQRSHPATIQRRSHQPGCCPRHSHSSTPLPAAVATAVAMAELASPSPAAPVSPQYTLLRVKRKRDDSPVVALILAGETEHASSSKRSAVTDIRALLSRTRLVDDEKSSASAAEQSAAVGRRAPMRRVFKLVGTVPHAAASPDDALLSRIAALQSSRQSKAVHPSTSRGTSLSEQRERQLEAQQQRATAARTEKIKEARAASAAATSSSTVYASAEEPLAPAPFTFLDVSITKHFPASAHTSAASQRADSGSAFQRVAGRPAVVDDASQQHRDALFSRAMTIVKRMPDKEKMAAYASLLDDYWQATTGSNDTQQTTFTQQLQQQPPPQAATEPPPEPAPRVLAGERIDLSSLAPAAQRLYAGSARSQSQRVDGADDEAQYVYDVYRVEADGDMEDAAADKGEAGAGAGEVASVVVDSRVAGWFGLVLDEEDVLDSDEDEEDENREGAEANDYPEEEDSEDGDEEDSAEEEQRMEAGAEDEEFYRLRQQLKRSQNQLIAMSDEELGDDDDDDDDDEDEDDEYAHSHRHYRGGQYDNEI